MRPLFPVLLAAPLLVAAFASPAHAQSKGFGVSRFEPSERGSEWFSLDSLDLRGHGRPAIGIVGEYQYRPLAIYNGDGSVRSSVVRHLLVLHPGASVVLWDRLRLGLNIPVQAYAEGEGGTLSGVTYAPPQNAQALGDIRLAADVRLFGKYGDAITGAVGLQTWLPTGNRDSFAGDGAIRLAPRAQIAGDIGAFAYGARAGFQYRYHQASFASAPVGSEVQFGVSAGVRLADKKLLIGPELYGSTVTERGGAFERRTTPLEVLLGGHYTAGDVRFGAGAGTGLTRGFGTPVVHALASLEWVPAIKKERAVEPPPPPVDLDRDKDGILDKDDVCPDDPGIATDDAKTHGCPDRDKDGVFDKFDACVDEPGRATDDPKTNGCPEPDRDKDGILDKDDVCPDDPGIATNDPATHGCPDRDKDGVFDKVDGCPDEPGPKDTDPKKNGCPKALVKDGQIMVLEQVRFKTASAEILKGPESEDVLNAVLEVLKSNPSIAHLRVEGHTDNRGTRAGNKTLSAARAASVVKWLVAHGIEAKRLASAGFGQEKPLDTNDTDEGRRRNRRVEFHIDQETK